MIPVFGLMEYFVEFIFVKRNWQVVDFDALSGENEMLR